MAVRALAALDTAPGREMMHCCAYRFWSARRSVRRGRAGRVERLGQGCQISVAYFFITSAMSAGFSPSGPGLTRSRSRKYSM